MLEHLIIGVALILAAAVAIGCSKRSLPNDADLRASLLLHAAAAYVRARVCWCLLDH